MCITLAGHHFGVLGWCRNPEENIATTLRRALAVGAVVALTYKAEVAPHGGTMAWAGRWRQAPDGCMVGMEAWDWILAYTPRHRANPAALFFHILGKASS